MAERIGVVVHAQSGPGILHRITGVIAQHGGDIVSVDIVQNVPETRVYFEIDLPDRAEALLEDIDRLDVVNTAALRKTMHQVYGKRIIIMGGGAQVGQVAIGAISEADR